jgi:hypothetical protein
MVGLGSRCVTPNAIGTKFQTEHSLLQVLWRQIFGEGILY